jgi:hypothetical protein
LEGGPTEALFEGTLASSTGRTKNTRVAK